MNTTVDCLQRLVGKLKAECNRYVNGQCSTLACLKRGGYKSGERVDYSMATCEAHEEVVALETLLAREEVVALETLLARAADDHHEG